MTQNNITKLHSKTLDSKVELSAPFYTLYYMIVYEGMNFDLLEPLFVQNADIVTLKLFEELERIDLEEYNGLDDDDYYDEFDDEIEDEEFESAGVIYALCIMGSLNEEIFKKKIANKTFVVRIIKALMNSWDLTGEDKANAFLLQTLKKIIESKTEEFSFENLKKDLAKEETLATFVKILEILVAK